MKKFVIAIVLAKLAFLSAVGLTACQTAQLSSLETSAAVTPTPTPNKADGSINRPTSEPYTGDLSIFESEDRAENLQIDRVMDILKIAEGKSVADLGAGSGWFSTRAAKRVGAKGKVFAVEINQEYINYINDRAKKENFTNIQTVLGTEDNPKLPDGSVDAVLILKTYHEIGQPIKVLENLRKALKKDALLGIIDKNGKGDDHGIDKAQVIEEAKRAGFALKEEFDFTKADGMDYFLVFRAAK
ncbi:MAG: class I SAM-dependent methyltransferase [Pyrinomonadaceae bacterium]|nr:class I SAM-dependent methyltransferase [Pyrinomonadaceae bacterium]